MFQTLIYLDEQFEDYLEGETRVHRASVFTDTRVHACLYFIAPTGTAYTVKIQEYMLLCTLLLPQVHSTQ